MPLPAADVLLLANKSNNLESRLMRNRVENDENAALYDRLSSLIRGSFLIGDSVDPAKGDLHFKDFIVSPSVTGI